jgi:DEAD/DEAH box helicase domain-containing protein
MIGAWQEVLEQVLAALRPGLARLAKLGADVPEAGPELADEKGQVVADAELGWVEQRTVVLRQDQRDLAEIWTAKSWKVCQLDDGLAMAGEQDWDAMVAELLGLT